MDNQHRKIMGYRELSQEEIELINAIKGHGVLLEELVKACRNADVKEGKNGDREHDERLDEASRWRDIAKTHFQQGLMALTRSVAKPNFF